MRMCPFQVDTLHEKLVCILVMGVGRLQCIGDPVLKVTILVYKHMMAVESPKNTWQGDGMEFNPLPLSRVLYKWECLKPQYR